MSTYDTTNTTRFRRHRDGLPFDTTVDLLDPADIFMSHRGPITVREALASSHLQPADLERIPMSFHAGVLWGALFCASLPKHDFSDIRLGGGPKYYVPEFTVRFKEEAVA